MALSLHSSPFYFLTAGHQSQPRGSCYRSQANSGATELPLLPVKQFQGENILGPQGFKPRTPA